MTREESIKRLPRGKQMRLHGTLLERAVHLYDVDKLSMEAVAREIGMPTPTVQNGVIAALCVKRGYRPAERDDNGYLTPAGLDRLREMMRKGMKGIDIQLRLGVSASSISNERRRYNADLKARGKRALPRPGGDARYCGSRLTAAQIREAEALLMTGLGSQQVADRIGFSSTSVIRIRARLVKRLARKGQAVTGCTTDGKRVRLIGLVHAVPPEAVEKLRALILDRVPIARAALMTNIGSAYAYRVRDQLKAELEAKGETLPPIIKLGRVKARAADHNASWLPKGRRNLILYRQHLRDADGDEREARRLTIRAIAERDGGDPGLAEQLDRMRRGSVMVPRFDHRRADPTMTLGGVASGAL